MTNQEKFIEVFGLDAWQQMIVFSGLAEQFREYWTSPYKESGAKNEVGKAIPVERLKDFRNAVVNMNGISIIQRLDKLIEEVENESKEDN